MKPFSRSSKAGFTLVELIVVIAILAILAGVAIPVYSGYIEKANQAADETLLATVNTAYGAACLENNADPRSVSASATLTDGKLTSVAPYNESFARYFAGNENSQFKHFASLIYNRTDGVFKGYGEGETLAFTIGETTLTVDAAQLSAYLSSTYDQLGSTTMAGKIDRLVNQAILALASDSVGNGLGESNGFKAFLEELNDKNKTSYEWTTMTNAEKANALVLYAASLADGINVDDSISSLLTGGGIAFEGDVYGNKVSSSAAEYALMLAYCSDPEAKMTLVTPGETTVYKQKEYADLKTILNATYDNEESKNAAITAWVKDKCGVDATWDYNNSTSISVMKPGTREEIDAKEWFDNYSIDSVGSIMGCHLGGPYDYDGMWDIFTKSEEFNNYISTQGKDDLSAYVSALQMVDANIGNVNIAEVLSSGWTNGGIADLLLYVTGN